MKSLTVSAPLNWLLTWRI